MCECTCVHMHMSVMRVCECMYVHVSAHRCLSGTCNSEVRANTLEQPTDLVVAGAWSCSMDCMWVCDPVSGGRGEVGVKRMWSQSCRSYPGFMAAPQGLGSTCCWNPPPRAVQSRPGLGTARWQWPINDAHLGHSGATGFGCFPFCWVAKCLLELSAKFL